MNKLPTVEELVEKLQAADLEFRRYVRDTETCPAYSEWFHFTAGYLLQYMKRAVWAEETKATWIPIQPKQQIPKGSYVRKEWRNKSDLLKKACEWVTVSTSYFSEEGCEFFINADVDEEVQQIRDLCALMGEMSRMSEAQDILAVFKKKWNITAKA